MDKNLHLYLNEFCFLFRNPRSSPPKTRALFSSFSASRHHHLPSPFSFVFTFAHPHSPSPFSFVFSPSLTTHHAAPHLLHLRSPLTIAAPHLRRSPLTETLKFFSLSKKNPSRCSLFQAVSPPSNLVQPPSLLLLLQRRCNLSLSLRCVASVPLPLFVPVPSLCSTAPSPSSWFEFCPASEPCNCCSCSCLPSINQNGEGGGGAILDQSAINGGGGAVSVALVFNQNVAKIDSNEYIWWKANARETKEELIDREPKFLN
ncbi:uncharacterized protein LOC130966773 [Arachis stenosperma]|uniref:uncharacterized protein LOC130966773 n=1 Tax=Arachis stenosperma TaxID=217475 RepID=UPI0025ABF981|nr:uncharacterized protein LOC130966773 [Arachis stenosperma]